MADLIFCDRCEQDVSHDGAYVVLGSVSLHRSCFVDRASDEARRHGAFVVPVAFVAGPNFDPEA